MIADHRLECHAHLLDEAGNTDPRPTRSNPSRSKAVTESLINPRENRRPAKNPGDEMLTLQEACRFLRVPEGTLRY